MQCPHCGNGVMDKNAHVVHDGECFVYTCQDMAMKIKPHPNLLVKYRDKRCEEMSPLRHAKDGDCGYDLAYAPEETGKGFIYAAAESSLRVLPGTFQLVPTGVFVKIPDGHFGLLCGRSSTFGKLRLFVVEARIDSGFTGELFIKLWHPSVFGGDFQEPVLPAIIQPWQRLAQLVIIPYASPQIEVVNELPQTERGTTGFGSSGR